MELTLTGKIWKFPDDVDTDTIIPGKRGTLPTIEEMGAYCFEHLRPEFASSVKPGDILVGGKNFGCGSSREQAPACIAVHGVKCIIAKSFARIFFRNAFNSGIVLIECDGIQENCEEGDIVTVEVNKAVTVNGKSYPISQIPDNLLEIVKDGGLLEHCKKINKSKEV
ncbi:3-isopropylmalate dehydratase [Veillonella sp. R32]|uniref:LeuD/DmdB family oxidoreductase small subunit n=1 Tax=Veillonella sp. R32 TaxID=2021312 RepID=UPI00138A1B5A|nr:3-isopropylmalate dehydratase [Veillonella sp. R32]KAF1683149.1 3-isopropylmalate dehydratase [Veillonella sp. R32]